MADFAEPPRWEAPRSGPAERLGQGAGRPRRRRRLPGVAWLGITAAVVLIAGLSYAVFLEMTLERTEPASLDEVGDIASIRVVPGMCVDEPLGEDRVMGSVPVVPCTEAHYGEVVAAIPFDLEEWPGAGHVQQRALARCAGALEPGAGLLSVTAEDAGLVWTVWAPTAATWSSGDRTAMCVVFADQPWEGSIFGGTASVGQ